MIANIGPASYNYEETVSTLRYANRAKNIKNKPKINEDPKDAMLREFQQEIANLRQQLMVSAITCVVSLFSWPLDFLKKLDEGSRHQPENYSEIEFPHRESTQTEGQVDRRLENEDKIAASTSVDEVILSMPKLP